MFFVNQYGFERISLSINYETFLWNYIKEGSENVFKVFYTVMGDNWSHPLFSMFLLWTNIAWRIMMKDQKLNIFVKSGQHFKIL